MKSTTRILSDAYDALERKDKRMINPDNGKFSAVNALARGISRQHEDDEIDHVLFREHRAHQIVSALMGTHAIGAYSDRCSYEHLLYIFKQALDLVLWCTVNDDYSKARIN